MCLLAPNKECIIYNAATGKHLSDTLYPAIMRVSKATHDAAADVLYGSWTFVCEKAGFYIGYCRVWERQVISTRYRHMITSLDLRLESCSSIPSNLGKFTGLKYLHLRLDKSIYAMYEGVGAKKSVIWEEVPGIRELLLVRGVTKLTIDDTSGHVRPKDPEKLKKDSHYLFEMFLKLRMEKVRRVVQNVEI
jgi:hypothetical protein